MTLTFVFTLVSIGRKVNGDRAVCDVRGEWGQVVRMILFAVARTAVVAGRVVTYGRGESRIGAQWICFDNHCVFEDIVNEN